MSRSSYPWRVSHLRMTRIYGHRSCNSAKSNYNSWGQSYWFVTKKWANTSRGKELTGRRKLAFSQSKDGQSSRTDIFLSCSSAAEDSAKSTKDSTSKDIKKSRSRSLLMTATYPNKASNSMITWIKRSRYIGSCHIRTLWRCLTSSILTTETALWWSTVQALNFAPISNDRAAWTKDSQRTSYGRCCAESSTCRNKITGLFTMTWSQPTSFSITGSWRSLTSASASKSKAMSQRQTSPLLAWALIGTCHLKFSRCRTRSTQAKLTSGQSALSSSRYSMEGSRLETTWTRISTWSMAQWENLER